MTLQNTLYFLFIVCQQVVNSLSTYNNTKEISVKMETKLYSIQETLINRIDNLTEALNVLTFKSSNDEKDLICNKY